MEIMAPLVISFDANDIPKYYAKCSNKQNLKEILTT